MLSIPRRFNHFVYGSIQSGLTSLVAAGIASFPLIDEGLFVGNWLMSWLLSWATMLPIVLLAAPKIRQLTNYLTREELAEGGTGL